MDRGCPLLCPLSEVLYSLHPPAQMCEAVRVLDRAQGRYKAYIDQLLAIVLEKCPNLLEGMPRLQQSNGLRVELLKMASKGEVSGKCIFNSSQ